MTSMTPQAYSVSTKVDELESRVMKIETLLRDIYNSSNTDTFPPELTEKLREFAYNRRCPQTPERN